jgi:hypothetical protein
LGTLQPGHCQLPIQEENQYCKAEDNIVPNENSTVKPDAALLPKEETAAAAVTTPQTAGGPTTTTQQPTTIVNAAARG